MRAAAGGLAVAAGDCAGGALGPVVADDAQPARRAVMMADAASTGSSPIRRRGAVHRTVPAANGGSREFPWKGRAAWCSRHVRWHQLSSLMSVPASAAGPVIRYPRCLQLDHPPGGVVHLRYGQAEPVPQAAEPFAAGPGDRLLQLPPADETSRAGDGAGHGCPIRCGQAAWVFMIWCRKILVHRGLPRVAWPGCLPGI